MADPKHVGTGYAVETRVSPFVGHQVTFYYQCNSQCDTMWHSKMPQFWASFDQDFCILICCCPYFQVEACFVFICVFFSHHASFSLKCKAQVTVWRRFESCATCQFLAFFSFVFLQIGSSFITKSYPNLR